MHRRRLGSIGAVIGLLLIGGCLWGGASETADGIAADLGLPINNAREAEVPVDTASTKVSEPSVHGLRFSLREQPGQAPEQQRTQEAVALKTTPLSKAEEQELFDRLPDLPASGHAYPFAKRKFSPPPPRTGKTVTSSFPPAQASGTAPVAGAAKALKVLRTSPQDEVELAAKVSVTFSQPMVAVGTVDAVAEAQVPVRLRPAQPGTWRWLGTRTVVFEPETERLPMATSFVVRVPAGTASKQGGRLAKDVTFHFATPPVQLEAYRPTDTQGTQPIVAVVFDQCIDPAAVLKHLKLRRAGWLFNKDVGLRLATADEIAADQEVSDWLGNYPADRVVVARPSSVLQLASEYRVVIPARTPSAEGPRVSTDERSFKFETYGPFRVVETRAGWGDVCRPGMNWQIKLSNAIDEDAFTENLVSIKPPLPNRTMWINGQWLTIGGHSKALTTYTVTLAAGLKDRFGQRLGSDVSREFGVAAPLPALFSQGESFVVMDPALKRAELTAYAMNAGELKIEVHKVEPKDWPTFLAYRSGIDSEDNPPKAPGVLVVDEEREFRARQDELIDVVVDLDKAFTNGYGHAIVMIEPGRWSHKWRRPRVLQWVQRTPVGLTALHDHEQLLVWATDLASGKPMADLEVMLRPASVSGKTASDGTVSLPLPKDTDQNWKDMVVAHHGQHVAMLPASAHGWSSDTWVARPKADQLMWYTADDRKLYKPGETLWLKGWLRRRTTGPQGGIVPVGEGVSGLHYRCTGPQGNEIAKGSLKLGPLSGFDLELTLPKDVNLGSGTIRFEVVGGDKAWSGRSTTHTFKIQEFRRPEFEVSVKATTPPPYFVGDSASLAIEALYYTGGSLADAPVTWRATATRGHYSPPGHAGFTFGRWISWWNYQPGDRLQSTQLLEGKTDAFGSHSLEIDFESVSEPAPMSVQLEGAVTDVNRQRWTASHTLLVHPANLYVGLKSDKLFVQKNQPFALELVVTDLDGKLVGERDITVEAVQTLWKQVKGSWQSEERTIEAKTLRSTGKAVAWSFTPTSGGQIKVRATVRDDRERPNQSELTLWVAGGERPPTLKVEREQLMLVPSKQSFDPGETAEILVQSPFYPAEGLLTLQREGLLSTQRFHMEGSSHTLTIPLTAAMVPNVHVQVDVVGASARADAGPTTPTRPAFATGTLDFGVVSDQYSLALEVTPQQETLEPGAQTHVDVVVRGADGKPVANAEVLVVVVDEAVLALTGYALSDPLGYFYPWRVAGVNDRDTRSSVVLVDPEQLETAMREQQEQAASASIETKSRGLDAGAAPPAPGAVELAVEQDGFADAEGRPEPTPAASGGEEPAVSMRVDLRALAHFAPALATDSEGQVRAAFKLPDSLTRYRIMVAAAAGEHRFGSGEGAMTARLPLMVRPSPPRFGNVGDVFQLPVVVHNQSDNALDVAVVVRAHNLAVTGAAGKRVSVPAGERVEVPFDVAVQLPGSAVVQVAAAAGALSDGIQRKLPVWTPATAEAFATYGVLDQGAAAYTIAKPTGVISEFGGLEITTSSTQLQALTDAVIYLAKYPYSCSEQLASRMLAVAALRPVLAAFEAEGLPKATVLEKSVARDVAELVSRQYWNGSFGLWRYNDRDWPYVTIHCAHALVRAQRAGFDVPERVLSRAQSYLQQIGNHLPRRYSKETKWSLRSYAAYVRSLMGDDVRGEARGLIREAGLKHLALDAQGWLLAAAANEPRVADPIVKYLQGRVEETPASAHFVTSFADREQVLLHSSRRTDAVVLDGLMRARPTSDVIPKLVHGLLAHKKKGRWSTTQENAFILLALGQYFQRYEKTTPDFVARVWLGGLFAGDQTYKGRTTERHRIDVPMPFVLQGKADEQLVIGKEGAGRLYYRVGLRYAPESLVLEPYDGGFTVTRRYEAVDDPADVKRQADGTWVVKAGSRVKVVVSMVAPARRYHVALVDPMPAGFEGLNPALATTGTLPEGDAEPRGWWWRNWYEHQNMRDERVEAFSALVWAGVYDYVYYARATTLGTFVVAPAKAEEMYQPEVFGRSASTKVVVR